MADKRPYNGSYDHGPPHKKARTNDSNQYGNHHRPTGSYNSSSPSNAPRNRPYALAGNNGGDFLQSHRPGKRDAYTANKTRVQSQVMNDLERLPNPRDCKPCTLAAEEMQVGLLGLLDKLVSDEAGSNGNTDIRHHARELRKLLSKRASASMPSKARRDLNETRPPREDFPLIPIHIEKKIESARTLPPLPPIAEPHLEEAAFTHISLTNLKKNQGLPQPDNYEKLEFLGDAYIEVIASRILYSRFPQLDVPSQSHLREQLVRNDTIGKFATAYCFDDRIQHGAHLEGGLEKGRAWEKILGDLFEAYVAALIMADPEHGFQIAEDWLTELWAPMLLAYKEPMIENPQARAELSKMIIGKGTKLDYREERPMVMRNGIQVYSMGVYLTGWGFENVWLGSGEGRNKAQASVAACNDALHRSEEVGVIPVARQKKQEIYESKPVTQAPKREPKKEKESTVNAVTVEAAVSSEIEQAADNKPDDKPEDGTPEDDVVDTASIGEKKKKKKKKKQKNRSTSIDTQDDTQADDDSGTKLAKVKGKVPKDSLSEY